MLSRFLEGGAPVVRVRLAAVQGSAPRDVGAEMFVSGTAATGTIGGGRLEMMATEAARELLASGEGSVDLDVPLGPEIGQCCGGRVSVSLVRMSEDDRRAALEAAEAEALALPHLYIFGSGHVGRALADLCQHLPFRCIVVDPRAGELALCTAAVEKRLSAMPEAEVALAPPGSAFVVLTHDHGLDFLIAGAALERGDAAYVGLIGSATKRARFERWFEGATRGLTCPIGGMSRDKRPGIIAALTVAEVTAALTGAAQIEETHSRRKLAIAGRNR